MEYGWFSQKAANMFGSSIYQAHDGSEVEVTYVDDDPKQGDYNWDDVVYVGEVKEWLREGSRGSDFEPEVQWTWG